MYLEGNLLNKVLDGAMRSCEERELRGQNQRVYVNAPRFFNNDIVDLLLHNERVGNDELVRTVTFRWAN